MTTEIGLQSAHGITMGLDLESALEVSQSNSVIFRLSFLYSPTLTIHMTTGETIALTRRTLVGKVMSLLFNMLSRLVITFLRRKFSNLNYYN